MQETNIPPYRFKYFFDTYAEMLSPLDRDRCAVVCKTWAIFLKDNIAYQNVPHMIREGIFGATLIQNGEPLYLRLERLTSENSAGWTKYKMYSRRIANTERGLLPSLIILMRNNSLPAYGPEFQDAWGYTENEFETFITNINSKLPTINLTAIRNNSVGSNHITTTYSPQDAQYICYITRNRDFNISSTLNAEFSVKSYIDSYSDLLICVGTNFTETTNCSIRGIFRNPYWVLKQRYSGLSMYLPSFICAVAEKYFPQKLSMQIRPTGSMLAIIKNNLQPGDGYTTMFMYESTSKTDITALKVNACDPEIYSICIKTSALTRLYYAPKSS